MEDVRNRVNKEIDSIVEKVKNLKAEREALQLREALKSALQKIVSKFEGEQTKFKDMRMAKSETVEVLRTKAEELAGQNGDGEMIKMIKEVADRIDESL